MAEKLEASGYDWLPREVRRTGRLAAILFRRTRQGRRFSWQRPVQEERVEVAAMKSDYQFGFHDPDQSVFRARKGIDKEIVAQMSEIKGEPGWMRDIRLNALEIFQQKPTPTWGGKVEDIDFDDIYYYVKPADREGAHVGRRTRQHQEDVRPAGHSRGRAQIPGRCRRAVRLRGRVSFPQGRPGTPRGHLPVAGPGPARASRPVARVFRHHHPAGGQQVCGAQHRGVERRQLRVRAARRHRGRAAAGVLPHQQRKHGAVRAHPHHRGRGRPGALREGCTAPTYSSESLHSAVVEIICKPGSRVRYTTIQNWPTTSTTWSPSAP